MVRRKVSEVSFSDYWLHSLGAVRRPTGRQRDTTGLHTSGYRPFRSCSKNGTACAPQFGAGGWDVPRFQGDAIFERFLRPAKPGVV